MHTTLPGHELTTEPFRWDQRLFAVILRMPGSRSSMPGKIGVHSGDPAIAAMCEVTGGNVKSSINSIIQLTFGLKGKFQVFVLKEVMQETDCQIVIPTGVSVAQYYLVVDSPVLWKLAVCRTQESCIQDNLIQILLFHKRRI